MEIQVEVGVGSVPVIYHSRGPWGLAQHNGVHSQVPLSIRSRARRSRCERENRRGRFRDIRRWAVPVHERELIVSPRRQQ